MAVFSFIISVLAMGFVASFFKVDTGTSRSDAPDYHLVPSAGDVWGA